MPAIRPIKVRLDLAGMAATNGKSKPQLVIPDDDRFTARSLIERLGFAAKA